MFVDFFKTIYDSGVEILDMNSLFGRDTLNRIVKTFVGSHLNRASSDSTALMIRIKTKKDIELTGLPEEVVRLSDYVIRFGLYANKPEVLKCKNPELFQPILDRWEANIKKIDGAV
jgi:hypothetical protein